MLVRTDRTGLASWADLQVSEAEEEEWARGGQTELDEKDEERSR